MKTLEVRLRRGSGDERVVGRLAEVAGRRVVFEYGQDFLREPLWLSPFKLPPQPGLIEHRDLAFGPIFGLFDDSLPDGWGLLLMDRFLRQQGAALAEVSPLDRLAFFGTRTMGALTYHPPVGAEGQAASLLDLGEMVRASREVLAGSAREVLPQLLRAGGSPGGARPKVLVGVSGETILSGEDDLPEGYAHWIVKFYADDEERDAGAIEFVYATMAREAGIAMPPVRLFETGRGERFFGVERFDRRGNHRFHVHTFGNLMHANFRVPSCGYGQLLEVTRILTKNRLDVLEAFRRMVFNVCTHNRDDHVKNFAFRMHDDGAWELAPAYDLVFAPGPGGEHTMTIDGEGRAPGRSQLLAVAAAASISGHEAQTMFDQVAAAASRWQALAREVGVSAENVAAIERAIGKNLGRLASA